MIIPYLAIIKHLGLYWLIALCVFYSHPSLATESSTGKPLQPIGIQATTHLGDHQTFRNGDVVSFLLSLDHDAYITAIYVDAHKNLYQVIPNTLQPNNFYKANLFIPVPPQDAAYTFKINPPYGEETLWVFASDTNNVRLKGKTLKNGMISLKQTLSQIRSALKNGSKKRFDEASVNIKTSAE